MRDADQFNPSVQRRRPVSSSDSSHTNTEPDLIRDILWKKSRQMVLDDETQREGSDLDFIEASGHRLQFV